MLTKMSLFTIGSVGLVFAAIGTGCEPTIDQGTAGSGGTGGSGGSDATSSSSSSNSTSSSSSSGSGGGTTVTCDPMNLPAEGSPCQTEGEFCSPGCEDPCSFCNVLTCTNGKWSNLEVFPAQCLSCEDVCVPVVAAKCSGGPPDQAACVQGCKQNQMGACKIPFNQMLACVGPTPTFTCDAKNRPTATGCEMQFDKLYACIMP
jgi:hypothetical protein